MKKGNETVHGTNRTHRAACLAIAAAVVILVAAAEKAEALPRVQRYVSVSVSPQQLDLGTVPQPGTYDSPADLTVHVAANCAHGGVVASATALQRAGGGVIPLARFFVKIPATGQYVAMTAPVAITGPMMPGVFDVVLKFRVETTLADIPGEYAGTITLTCTAGP